MIKGYWEERFDKMCESIYLVDRKEGIAYTFELTAHKIVAGQENPATEISLDDPAGVLKGLAEALQMGGYIPRAANDAELKATKYHLEDMRKLTLKDT